MPRGRITWLRRARDVRRAPQVLDSLPPRTVPSLALALHLASRNSGFKQLRSETETPRHGRSLSTWQMRNSYYSTTWQSHQEILCLDLC